MVDPVNLNVPGLPYLLFALVFFAAVFLLVGVLSPIELAIQRHQRSKAGADGDDEDGARSPDDEAAVLRIDQLLGALRDVASTESRSGTTVYECRRCGTTLDAGDDRCPHCETPTVARYEIT